MNSYKIYCGMVPEYEIIATDAPQSAAVQIIKQMYLDCEGDYKFYFGRYGYDVVILGCQDDFDSVPDTNFCIDLSDFEED